MVNQTVPLKALDFFCSVGGMTSCFEGAVIEVICKLNNTIAQDPLLGKGFRIGHDRFCADTSAYNDARLRNIVEYSIIPLLSEYWIDEPSKLDRWVRELRGVFNGY